MPAAFAGAADVVALTSPSGKFIIPHPGSSALGRDLTQFGEEPEGTGDLPGRRCEVHAHTLPERAGANHPGRYGA